MSFWVMVRLPSEFQAGYESCGVAFPDVGVDSAYEVYVVFHDEVVLYENYFLAIRYTGW